MKQLSIPQQRYSKRKVARTISLRGANHITLKANAFILRKNHRVIKQLIHTTQIRYGMKLQAVAIMGNHVHLLAKVRSRKSFADALRFLASRIALSLGNGKLWNIRAWSRPVVYQRDLRHVTNYVVANPFAAKIYHSSVDSYCIQGGVLVDVPVFEEVERGSQVAFEFS